MPHLHTPLTKEKDILHQVHTEPIHFINSIQPWGACIVLSGPSLRVVQVSRNCREWVGVGPEEMIGRKLDAWTTEDCASNLVKALKGTQKTLEQHNPMDITFVCSPIKCHGVLHRTNVGVVLELQPINPDSFSTYHKLSRSLSVLESCSTVQEMAEAVVEEVSSMFQYERTMMYQFEKDYSGIVIAEHLTSASIEPFLHLHYPETDIPQCARSLFLKKPLRMICNADDVSVPIFPEKASEEGHMLDLSWATLRSPSFCHAAYMKHMDTYAGCSNAILLDGKLWGLLICYNSKPVYKDYYERSAIQLFSQAVSILLQTKLQQESRQYEDHWKGLQTKLFEIMASEKDLAQGMVHRTPNLMDLMPSCGASVFNEGTIVTMGSTPSRKQIEDLASWLPTVMQKDLWWCTDRLDEIYPPARDMRKVASGIMAVQTACGRRSFIMWYRAEVVYTLAWGGNYHSCIGVAPEGHAIARSDFKQYRERIQGRSELWSGADMAAARLLRNTFVEVMSSRAGELRLQSEVLESFNDQLEKTNAQLERTANELQQLIQTVPVPIISLDLNGDIHDWNPMAEKNTGFCASEVSGTNFVKTIVAHTHQVNAGGIIDEALRGKLTPEVEVSLYHKDTKMRVEWCLQAAPKKDKNGSISGVVIVAQDTTERQSRIQAQVRAAHYAAANDAKSRFLATMSHEMRTPLNGVLGMLQLAMECEMTKMGKEYIEKAFLSGEHLLSLISDILDLSQIEAGKIDIRTVPFNIRALIQSVITMVSPRAESKNLEFESSVAENFPTWVAGDPDRIKQVLINLCINAVKYSERGKIFVNCSLAPTEEATSDRNLVVRIEVVDQGLGIRKEDLAALFTMFTRIRNENHQDPGGTGLGLNICKQLIDRMHGKIGASSVYGDGSIFWFELPLTLECAPAPSLPLPATGDTKPSFKARIMVVDDNEFNLQVAKAMLSKASHHVETAVNGLDSVTLYTSRLQQMRERSPEKGAFDLILMDCEMPIMNGYDAVKSIRAIEQTERCPRVPVVALTAHAMKDHSNKCMDSGMDNYLTKPINKKALLDMVACYTSSKNTQASLRPDSSIPSFASSGSHKSDATVVFSGAEDVTVVASAPPSEAKLHGSIVVSKPHPDLCIPGTVPTTDSMERAQAQERGGGSDGAAQPEGKEGHQDRKAKCGQEETEGEGVQHPAQKPVAALSGLGGAHPGASPRGLVGAGGGAGRDGLDHTARPTPSHVEAEAPWPRDLVRHASMSRAQQDKLAEHEFADALEGSEAEMGGRTKSFKARRYSQQPRPLAAQAQQPIGAPDNASSLTLADQSGLGSVAGRPGAWAESEAEAAEQTQRPDIVFMAFGAGEKRPVGPHNDMAPPTVASMNVTYVAQKTNLWCSLRFCSREDESDGGPRRSMCGIF